MGRAISEKFKTSLLTGDLKILLDEVKNDNTLIMELRGGCVVIYYRGGALFTVSFDDETNNYSISYNKAYWGVKKIHEEIEEQPTIENVQKYIAFYKHQMDYHRVHGDRELEKQGQQQLILENNIWGGKSNQELSDKKPIPTGDYFIIDMEYAYKNEGIDARFDAIALKWPSLSNSRKNGKGLGISFLELKYYDGAMGGRSGIDKHISDFLKFTQEDQYSGAYVEMCKDMALVFRQKCELGIVPSYTSRLDMSQKKYLDISIDPNNVEMIFMFINRDPDSSVAARELYNSCKKYGKDNMKNIYIANASDLGYIMFRYGDKGKADRYMPVENYIRAYGYGIEE